MAAILDVLLQHAEGGAFTWSLREHSTRSPHYRLADLARLDGQLDAHLDGLRIAEAVQSGLAWQVCLRELCWGGAGELFLAAALSFQRSRPDDIENILELAAASCQISRAYISALGWTEWPRISGHAASLMDSQDPARRRIGIAAAAAHRRDPLAALPAALDDPDELLRSRALRAVGELGRSDLLHAARSHLSEPSDSCRFDAAWSETLLGGESISTLCQFIEQAGERSDAALQLALRRMDRPTAADWLLRLASQSGILARMAVTGTGILGCAHGIPWLLDWIQTPALARISGEAFSMITGVDLADQDLEGRWPEGFEAGPNDDPEDENVELDPDENLPWPDVQKVKDWWMRHRSEFQPGLRYLCGRPMTEDWLEHVLRHGYQRQRAAAALELAIRRPGTPLFNVKAPGYRQQQWLGLR